MKLARNVSLVAIVIGLVAAAMRVRGSGGRPPSNGAWKRI